MRKKFAGNHAQGEDGYPPRRYSIQQSKNIQEMGARIAEEADADTRPRAPATRVPSVSFKVHQRSAPEHAVHQALKKDTYAHVSALLCYRVFMRIP